MRKNFIVLKRGVSSSLPYFLLYPFHLLFNIRWEPSSIPKDNLPGLHCNIGWFVGKIIHVGFLHDYGLPHLIGLDVFISPIVGFPSSSYSFILGDRYCSLLRP
jgi:hypothetical protein